MVLRLERSEGKTDTMKGTWVNTENGFPSNSFQR